MPEGPTILLMKEDLQKFAGRRVTGVEGSEVPENSKIKGEILREIKTFGKQTYLIFDKVIFKIHLMMFGSYSLFKRTDIDTLKLGLRFKDEGIYFYTCVVKVAEKSDLSEIDWEADIMSEKWSDKKAIEKMQQHPGMMICDAMMNQDIFAGVGNIIKNESLFRAGIHPESRIKNVTESKLKRMIKETKAYSFEFLKYKRTDTLSKTFKVYHQKKCPKCGAAITKKETGRSKRMSFFCEKDQKLF